MVKHEVSLHKLNETIVSRIFLTRQWVTLTTGLPTYSLELVRKFYFNIHAISDNDSFEVSLQTIHFRVTPDMLANLLNAPRVPDMVYLYLTTLAPRMPIIVECLIVRYIAWNGRISLHMVKFPPNHLLLSRIILTNLYPTAHHSKILNFVSYLPVQSKYAVPAG